MGLTLLQAYCFGDMSLEGSLNKVILSDPLGYGRDAKTFYTYRIKHFLRAAALGFSSSKPWNGKEGADGGMIFVDKNWNFSCMMSSRKDFENSAQMMPGIAAIATDDPDLEVPEGIAKLDINSPGAIANFVVTLKADSDHL